MGRKDQERGRAARDGEFLCIVKAVGMAKASVLPDRVTLELLGSTLYPETGKCAPFTVPWFFLTIILSHCIIYTDMARKIATCRDSFELCT